MAQMEEVNIPPKGEQTQSHLNRSSKRFSRSRRRAVNHEEVFDEPVVSQAISQTPPAVQPDIGTCSLAKFCGWLRACWSGQQAKKPQVRKFATERNLREFLQQRRSRKVRTILQQLKGCQKTLVLDLDETLVHSGISLEKWDFRIEVQSARYAQYQHEGKKHTAYTKLRGGLSIFLTAMSQHYELVIFTAGIPDLANKVIDKIDPEGLIKHRIFREHCIEVQFSNRIYLKNLNLLNRRLQDVVLMDNSQNSGLLNPENLLAVSSFYQDEHDQQLLRLIPFLVYLSGLPDVRDVEKHRFEFFKDRGQCINEVPPERKRTLKLKTVRMDVQLQTINHEG